MVQESMEHLETPALLLCFHQLTLLALLWTLSPHSAFDLSTLKTASVQAALPSAFLTALTLLCYFSSLNDGSLLLVASYVHVATAAIEVAVPRFLGLDSSGTLPPSSMVCSAVTCHYLPGHGDTCCKPLEWNRTGA